MRWPWQKREPDPGREQIAERMAEHMEVLEHVGQLLGEESQLDRTAQLMDDYERADRERRQ